MSLDEDKHRHETLLSQKAEAALRGKLVEVSDLPPEDFKYLLHELQVHQAELSIQNEELRQTQLELETARDLYADLYNTAPVGYCTLNRKDTILEANQTLGVMLGVNQVELIGQSLSRFIDPENQDEYYLYRQSAFEEHQRVTRIICMVKHSGEKIIVRLESMLVHANENNLRVILSDITQQHQTEKEAQEAAALRELRKRVNEQREQERQQMARDLHDGPVQGLVAITFALRGMLMDHPYTEIAQQLEDIQSDLQDQIGVLRTYAMELRPPMLAQFGLERTIRSHSENFQEKHPHIRVHIDLHQTASDLGETVSLALFRIYQEALNNILRHVKNENIQVFVRLIKNDHLVRFEIQDNGQGFGLPGHWLDLVREGHLGLVGMRERAEGVGGKIEIDSKTGEGTRIMVSVPLD